MLRLIITAARVTFAVALVTMLGCVFMSFAEASDVKEIRSILDGVPEQIADHDHRVSGTLQDLTARLERIEAAIAELQTNKEPAPAPIIEPPAEPIKLPAPATQTQSEQILQSYRGQPWHVVGRRGDKQHLIRHMHDHGSTDDLQRYSNAQLERIHGAMHTQHPSASMYARGPGDARFRRIRPTQQTTRRYPAKIIYNSQNCPNGVCPIQRKR